MRLGEFLATANADNTIALTEAQAFTITSYRKIGGNEARQIFIKVGALDDIEAAQANNTPITIKAGFTSTVGQAAKGIVQTIQNGTFATDPDQKDGKTNRDAAALMVALGVMTQAQVDEFFNAALVEEKPFENVTLEDIEYHRQEVLDLPQNNQQHIIDFTIANSAREMTGVVVEHRFGTDNTDLTEWHPCGSTRVHYKQQGYRVQVGASPAAYRELRLVSPVTLGVSVA